MESCILDLDGERVGVWILVGDFGWVFRDGKVMGRKWGFVQWVVCGVGVIA